MSLEQLREQNNKITKEVGVATSLLNTQDESAYIRWETCDPEVARISTGTLNLFIKKFHVGPLKWLL